MTASRTLPVPATHREFTVKVGGRTVSRESHLQAVSIAAVANRIAWARLAYVDGSPSGGTFALSDAATFVPGADVEILAGSSPAPASLFKGVVVRQSIQVRDHAAPQLIVDCRHPAFKLAVCRHDACYLDQTDSDIIGALLSGVGLSGDVQSTSVKHAQLVQYRTTDWDFLLARAEANGRLVLTLDGTVAVRAPDFGRSPVCELRYGATVLEVDVEMDARIQHAAVKAVTWDPARQETIETDGVTPATAGPGNVSGDDLAGVAARDGLRLVHAALDAGEAQAWADAAWLKSRLSKVGGRVKCEGIGSVRPGDVVTLSGVGARFSGDVFVTGVRHDFDLLQGWKTHLQFGGTDAWAAEVGGVTAPVAAALVPGASGLQVGVVTDNEDPEGEHRVRVRLPLVDRDGDGVWARVASLDAGADRGFFFRPELGDEVVVGFLDDDPRRPVMLGMLHSSARAAPLVGSDDNHEKVFQSRAKMMVYFNDDTKVMKLETPAGNRITLSEDQKVLRLEDQNGNKIELTPDGVAIQSTKAIQLSAGTEIKQESGTSLEARAGTDLKLEGAASAQLSSSATTTVKGGMVLIN